MKMAKKARLLVFGLFAALLLLVTIFHEPWYDEAQAWQIARCASIRDILILIPHYEGHPPLWHLLLAIPAKLGVPYEFGLKSVNFTVALLTAYLILFKSPFRGIVRYLLPFHYFLFYQYGVVARPYGCMALVLILLAMAFPKRNQKPWLFGGLLLLQCLLSAYGIVLSGGIAIAWCIEILSEARKNHAFGSLPRDGRVYVLLGLLFSALLMIAEISPREDTVIAFAKIGSRVPWCLLYTFFVALPDTSVIMAFQGEGILRYSSFPFSVMALGGVIGICMLIGLTAYANRSMVKYFWIPYACLATFSAVVYFAVHHMGIVFLFTVFWSWIQAEDGNCGEVGKGWKEKAGRMLQTQNQGGILQKVGKVMCYAPLVIPVIWSLFAAGLEIQNPYYYSREAAKFMLEHGLDKASVMTAWSCPAGMDGQDAKSYLYEEMNTSIAKLPIAILPYLQENVVRNLNLGANDKGYVINRVPSARENEEMIAKWREFGPPEVILGSMNLDVIFDGEVTLGDYIMAYEMHPMRINVWKMLLSGEEIGGGQYIYVRRDCKEKYGL